MPKHQSLQGWEPEITNDLTLTQIIEFAFDYRGDVTVLTKDGTEFKGYLFNRGVKNNIFWIQLMLSDRTNDPMTIPYADIVNFLFTGRVTANGISYLTQSCTSGLH